MKARIRDLGIIDYAQSLQAMQVFTQQRTPETMDEIWCLQHPAVFSQGYAGKAEHILNPQHIPIVQSDRGGQVTYHGPGQLVCYTLVDLKRLDFKVRDLVCALERAAIQVLSAVGIEAEAKRDAPGVYVDDAKICSLGLRIKRGYSFHGLALNIDMDLKPFDWINPCGFKQLKMTQIKDFIPDVKFMDVQTALIETLAQQLGYTQLTFTNEVIHESIE